MESLFQIESELRFRIAAYFASLIEPPGQKRLLQFRKVKKLYDLRSKAVHGMALSEDILVDHIRQVRILLVRAIKRIVEFGKLPTGGLLDELLFGDKWIELQQNIDDAHDKHCGDV